jgi:Mrp family chromosome partitioning ATPase
MAPPLAGSVQVLPAGRTKTNPHALMSASRLQRALLEATALADKVVVDGTPLGLVKDVLPIGRQVDAVVVVARLHHTRRREFERMRELLASAGIEPFGLVLFGVESDAAYDEYLGRRR